MAQIYNWTAGSEEDPENKRGQDVLAGGAAGAEQNNPEQPGYSPPKGTTPGLIGQTGAGGVQQGAGQAGPQATDVLSQGNIEASKAGAGVDTSRESDEITRASAELDKGFKDWTTTAGQSAEKANVADDIFAKALEGDSEAMTSVTGRLGGSFAGPDAYKAGAAPKDLSGLNPAEAAARNAQKYRQESGGQYTVGMNSLDQALAKQAGGYDFTNLFLQNQGLADKNAKYTSDAEALGTTEKGEYDAYTTALRQKLSDAAKGILTSQDAEMQAYNASLPEMQAAATKSEMANQKAEIDKMITALGPDAARTNPEQLNYLIGVLKDVESGKYVENKGPEGVAASDFIDASEAERLNRIYGMLGESPTYQAGTKKDGTFGKRAANWSNIMSSLPGTASATSSGNSGTRTEKVINTIGDQVADAARLPTMDQLEQTPDMVADIAKATQSEPAKDVASKMGTDIVDTVGSGGLNKMGVPVPTLSSVNDAVADVVRNPVGTPKAVEKAAEQVGGAAPVATKAWEDNAVNIAQSAATNPIVNPIAPMVVGKGGGAPSGQTTNQAQGNVLAGGNMFNGWNPVARDPSTGKPK
jgi:hypothetical protein